MKAMRHTSHSLKETNLPHKCDKLSSMLKLESKEIWGPVFGIQRI